MNKVFFLSQQQGSCCNQQGLVIDVQQADIVICDRWLFDNSSEIVSVFN